MNPLQMALQIRHKLRKVTWPSGGSVVFGPRAAFVVAEAPAEDQIPAAAPFCFVVIGEGTADPDEPSLLEQDFTVVGVAEVAGDPLGEFAIIGGSRISRTSSAGAGAGEIAERIRHAIQDLTGADGAPIQLSATRLGSSAALGRGKHMAPMELGVTAVCTSAPYYAPPQQLARSGSTWEWVGAHCAARFDFKQFRLGYKVGTEPPETPDDADAIVYTGVATTTTIAPVESAAYAIWADYNSHGWTATTVEGSSSGNEVGAFLRAGSSGLLPSEAPAGDKKCCGCAQTIDVTTDPFPSYVTIDWQGEPEAHGKCELKKGTLSTCVGVEGESCSFNGTLTVTIDFEDPLTDDLYFRADGDTNDGVNNLRSSDVMTPESPESITFNTSFDAYAGCDGIGGTTFEWTIMAVPAGGVGGTAIPGKLVIYCSECEYCGA
jgi:hypothetical protein